MMDLLRLIFKWTNKLVNIDGELPSYKIKLPFIEASKELENLIKFDISESEGFKWLKKELEKKRMDYGTMFKMVGFQIGADGL
jgi:hypothetical protein